MKQSGPFIIIPRETLTTDIWPKKIKFSKLEAFLFLVNEARFQNEKSTKRDIEYGYGQVVFTLNELMTLWHLGDKTEVKRYLDFLEKRNLIIVDSQKNGSLISVKHLLECYKNATGFATQNATQNATPKYNENQYVTSDDATQNATDFATQNATILQPHQETSHAQVVLNLFNDSDINAIDKEKEKEENKKKKVPTTELEKQFEVFRLKYKEFGGSVRGFSTELEWLQKKHKDWKEIIPMLLYSLERENRERVEAQMMGKFFPRMQKCQTYLNQRSWEAYSDGYEDYDPNEYHPEGFMYDAEFDAYRFCDYIPNVDLRDGYKDEDRPDGARIVEQLNVWVWNKEQQKWNRA